VADASQGGHGFGGMLGFQGQGHGRALAQDKMGLDVRAMAQDFEEPDAVNDAAGSGNADDKTFHG